MFALAGIFMYFKLFVSKIKNIWTPVTYSEVPCAKQVVEASANIRRGWKNKVMLKSRVISNDWLLKEQTKALSTIVFILLKNGDWWTLCERCI